MDEFVVWLRERIAARRTLAEDAKGRSTGEWTFRDTAEGQHKVVDELSYTISATNEVDTNPWRTGPHIAANDPRTVLDLCDAHTMLLDEHTPMWRNVEWPHDQNGKGQAQVCPRCQNAENDSADWRPLPGKAGEFPHDDFVTAYVLAPCRSLRVLAL